MEWSMGSLVGVTFHSSQFPDAVRTDLIESLRRRQINPKFHYDSIKQAQKWLAVHEAYSPFVTDPNCAAIYGEAARETAAECSRANQTHVIGLGCGTGQKDSLFLKRLSDGKRQASYFPCDVSPALVLAARETVTALIPDLECQPVIFDIANAPDLPDVLKQIEPANSTRLITFFGMIPNFQPDLILPILAGLVRRDDQLLLSANLTPQPEDPEPLWRILPQYDNALTRDWLLTLLLDLGVERSDGEMRFAIEEFPSGSGWRRIAALFEFKKDRAIKIDRERFAFPSGSVIRLFFSYRYTADQIHELLVQFGLFALKNWISQSGEEGVFLCRRDQPTDKTR